MKTIIFALTLLCGFCHAQPNIWLIMADDVSDKYINAKLCPDITRMARQGIRYDNAWATPKCGPTRCSIMSGKRAKIHGVKDNNFKYRLPSSTFLPNKLSYTSGVFGKYNMPFPIEESGFNRQVVWEPHSLNGQHSTEIGIVGSRFINPAYSIDGVMQNGLGKFGPTVFYEEAVKFANESVANNERFFLYHPMVLGHGMRNHKYPFGNNYNRNIREIDFIVGEILDWARQDGNTTVIFCTDNPTATEGKSEISERGCKVALVIWGPTTPAKGRINRRVQLRDLHDYVLTGRLRPRTYNLTDFRNKSVVKKGNLVGVATTNSSNFKNLKVYRNGRKVDVSKNRKRQLYRIIKTGK